ncbi:hypothetical protein AB0J74_06290 [Asanoa sp. NPDC049573]|uniref:hypothetical protein n=1 Tax=Asanoa sp. NPDC049573 TaxID=3155396 RepID=UPI003444F692
MTLEDEPTAEPSGPGTSGDRPAADDLPNDLAARLPGGSDGDLAAELPGDLADDLGVDLPVRSLTSRADKRRNQRRR